MVAVPFHLMGMSFNVMSLGGIALAAGAMVDAAIIVVEQTHKKLEEWERQGGRRDAESIILSAVKEVGRPAFFSLLTMAVAFLPVLAPEGQEGRLVHPLAYGKSLTLLVAALLAITLDPALRLTLARLELRDCGRLMNSALRSKIRREEENPLIQWLIRIYQPALLFALKHKFLVAVVVLVAAVGTVPVYRRLGAELIPTLDEGVLLYMPSTVSGISITEAKRLLQLTDDRLKTLPEVAQVLGKAGRADTSTDVAPLSML
jgi:Cu(I)/Ag(I) efflux system membrane protein CusA/SilA